MTSGTTPVPRALAHARTRRRANGAAAAFLLLFLILVGADSAYANSTTLRPNGDKAKGSTRRHFAPLCAGSSTGTFYTAVDEIVPIAAGGATSGPCTSGEDADWIYADLAENTSTLVQFDLETIPASTGRVHTIEARYRPCVVSGGAGQIQANLKLMTAGGTQIDGVGGINVGSTCNPGGTSWATYNYVFTRVSPDGGTTAGLSKADIDGMYASSSSCAILRGVERTRIRFAWQWSTSTSSTACRGAVPVSAVEHAGSPRPATARCGPAAPAQARISP